MTSAYQVPQPSQTDKEVVIGRVRADREDLARVLKKHTGIRRIVEELYPDSAHFIFELLQNAEDTGATEVAFALNRDSLSFEHNGRAFTEADILGITDVGEGTKSDDEDKIGRFGVGFKAVFAYTDSPRVWSPTYSFQIDELVLPSLLDDRSDLGTKTRFEFPFNNAKKPAGPYCFSIICSRFPGRLAMQSPAPSFVSSTPKITSKSSKRLMVPPPPVLII